MIRSHRSALRACVAVLALLASIGTAAAFMPADRDAGLGIPLNEYDLFTYRSAVADAARSEAAAAFSARNSGTWKVYGWNPQTGTANRFYGSGLEVRASFSSVEDVAAAAREIVRQNPEMFGAEVENLRVASTPEGYGKKAVHFQQTYHGVDVYGATVMLVFTETGRFFVGGSDYHRGITVNPRPSIPASVARDIALRGVSPYVGRMDESASELLVLPVPVSETEVTFHLVWKSKVWVDEPIGLWATFVDAHSGEIVYRYDEVCHVNFVGDTSGLIQRFSYCDGQGAETMPYLRLNVSGVGTTYANADGDWSLNYAGSDPKTVTADLYSPYVDLDNAGGAEAAFSGTATPGVPFTVAWTDLNAQKDEKDVYRAVNDIHDFYQDIHPTYGYINEMMPARVSIASTCNAYYVSHTINFYQAGGGCGNTGEIMGVVHHEFCHGITENLLGNQGTQGIGEGNSDVLSNLMTGDPIIGRGFYLNNCTSGIRNSENTLIYPDDLNGSIHHDGQIIAGFHWDSWQELQGSLTPAEALHIVANTWHWGRYVSHPTTQPNQVLATFTADDDDGDLTNGTPHYDAFCVGATNHGFSCPEILVGVFIVHNPLGSRTTPGDAVALATIYSTEGGLVADSTRLNYRIGNGPMSALLMQPTGQPNEYSATMPNLQLGDEVTYYLRARDTAGNFKTSPANAPTDMWAFDICNILDPLEVESGWTVNAEGTDNATSGLWTRVDPNGTTYNGIQIQTENDRTPDPGTMCWVTGQGTVGGAAGEQDVDGGATTLYSPVYDLTGSTFAKAKWNRWYTDDRGVNAGDDNWVVQVRNNGGAWQDVENTGEEAGFWKLISSDLFALFGASLGQVQFKFIASDTGVNSLLEAAVDDFEILNRATESVSDWTGTTARFALMGSRPNPARPGAEIGFAVPVQSSVRLEIYDVSGRQVKVLADDSFAAGVHAVAWDGQDARGHAAASGIYYVRMQAGEFNSTRTVVLAR